MDPWLERDSPEACLKLKIFRFVAIYSMWRYHLWGDKDEKVTRLGIFDIKLWIKNLYSLLATEEHIVNKF